ncbi:MAG: hypothetical protein V7642_6011 [Burkholderiales bacterium]|jgi:hypothetical protein
MDKVSITVVLVSDSDTTVPPFCAISEVKIASWFTCNASAAFCLTVAVSSNGPAEFIRHTFEEGFAVAFR